MLQTLFLGSFDLQDWTRGAMNRLTEVGRVTPSTLRSSDGLVSALGISATEDGCAPFFALEESVVAAVGAQRTARPTFRFMESFNLQDWTRIEVMNLPSEFVLVPRPSSSCSIFWRRDGFEDEDEGRGREAKVMEARS
jgi:hypothetical protein